MSENNVIESKETFINYLNNEIDQIREDIKMPGWTNWAILAALASVGWFIIQEIEKNIFVIEQTYLLFIILSMSYTILREFYDFFKPNQANKKIRYFTIDVLFREKRLAIVINILQASLMLFLLSRFSKQVGIIPYYLSLFHYGFILVSPILVLLIENSIRKFTSTNFYIPDTQNYNIPIGVAFSSKKKTQKTKFVMNLSTFPSVFMVIIVSYLLISYSLLYFHLYGLATTPPAYSSLKIAILVFSIFLLLRLLVYSEQTSPTLKDLVDIRRDLVFGNIDLEMAKKLAEISISGLNKSSIIQREITTCIMTLQGIDTELNKAAQKNKVASGKLQEIKGDANAESQITLWEAIRDATLSHFRQARKIYLSDKSLRGGIIKFIQIYGAIEPYDTDFTEAIKNMAELYIEVKKKYDKTIDEWLNLAVKYEGDSASKKWREIALKELDAELPQKSLEQKTG
jgi:hypothetical protein